MKSGTSTPGRWERLGALLIQRRTQLSPRFHNRGAFTGATGLKYRLIYDIEEARRTNFGSSTLAAIEAAYRLAPGAIGRFLAGGSDGEILPAPAAALSGSGTLAAAPPPRRDVEFHDGSGSDEALQPYIREVLQAAYGTLVHLFGDEVPEPDDPRAEAAMSALPGAAVFPGDDHQAVAEAETWDKAPNTFRERVTIIAIGRRLRATADERENRRTGLSHNPAASAIRALVSVGGKALRASP